MFASSDHTPDWTDGENSGKHGSIRLSLGFDRLRCRAGALAVAVLAEKNSNVTTNMAASLEFWEFCIGEENSRQQPVFLNISSCC